MAKQLFHIFAVVSRELQQPNSTCGATNSFHRKTKSKSSFAAYAQYLTSRITTHVEYLMQTYNDIIMIFQFDE